MSENKNDVLETIKKMLEKGLDVSKDLQVLLNHTIKR